ncbi:MAG: rhodanese-like domain-containing protein [Gammaproteobacteria bacterium]|nr:rhodanese-like domain-containing protein [Gammaproteobacteria bacterium]MDH5777882.1 rhodanese-like domain-containing protein [Gammaproteobacteria bacterium]
MTNKHQIKSIFSLMVGLGIFVFAINNTQAANNRTVNITHDIPYVDVKHKGKTVRIVRQQEPGSMVDPDFAQTSRPCPPYCVQPIKLAPGVETIGEIELLEYLQKVSRGKPVLVIDSREADWLKKGMIPGATHIPWTKLHNKTASDEAIADILQLRFNAVHTGALWNFEIAKTLVFYCNGPWCGQSPTNIRALLSIGYPAHKIKWYRGGMQAWLLFGLTTVKP